jgi:hypothetical protein
MRHNFRFASVLILSTMISILLVSAASAPESSYYPPPGEWARKKPAEVGMDAAKLDEAVAFMKSHESTQARDFSDQKSFLKAAGIVPTERAATNGLDHPSDISLPSSRHHQAPTRPTASPRACCPQLPVLPQQLDPRLDDAVVNVIEDGGYESFIICL